MHFKVELSSFVAYEYRVSVSLFFSLFVFFWLYFYLSVCVRACVRARESFLTNADRRVTRDMTFSSGHNLTST